MKIKIEELGEIFEKIIFVLKQKNIQEIDFNCDYYWSIDDSQKFDVYNTPNDFSIGQVSDDLSELIKYIDDVNELDVLTLERLIAILQAIDFENTNLFAK